MGVEASVVVYFEGQIDESGNTSVELDDKHSNNLDEDGELKGTFSILHDSPVFLIHHDTDRRVVDVKSTDGSVSKIDTNVYRTREAEGILFSSVGEEYGISYFNINSVSASWYGNSPVISVSDSIVTAKSGSFPCRGDLSFSVKFNESWKLVPPRMTLGEDESYEISIVVYMEKV